MRKKAVLVVLKYKLFDKNLFAQTQTSSVLGININNAFMTRCSSPFRSKYAIGLFRLISCQSNITK